MTRSNSAIIARNRANSLHSTGPRSVRGKRRSSQNAITHGLLSKKTLLSENERPEYEALRASLFADLSPMGATEELLADQVLAAAWRLRRLLEIDAGVFQAAILGKLDGGVTKVVSEIAPKLARYGGSIETSFYRALSALNTLQSQRMRQSAISVESENVEE